MVLLSVVIPTHNRRRLVHRLLKALEGQDFARSRFETIVVADGCADDTSSVLSAERWTFRLQVIEQAQQGQGAARNHGAAHANGEFLVFFDDDMVPPPDFLSRLAREVNGEADVVVPFARVPAWIPDNLLVWEQRAWDREVLAGMSRPAGPDSIDYMHFMATAVRKSAFDALGGFDPAFTAGGAWGKEDTELAYRFVKHGYRVTYRPDLIIDSDCITDPRTALRRGRDLGRNDVRFARKHPELAERLLGGGESRIQRVVGAAVVRVPALTSALWPLRALVLAAIRRGERGALLHRLWVLIWAAEWWRGVVDADGQQPLHADHALPRG